MAGQIPAAAPAGQPGDGLFGPGSVTWQVIADPLMWVAGFRAAYLQALHPRVIRGTWQNSAFASPEQVWGRLIRTAEFIRVRTYGSLSEVERAGRRVRRLHASLRGTDADGTHFALDDPELLLWVHCCEIGSYTEIARRSGMRLGRAELDRFVDEQRRSAAVVGLDPAKVPATTAALARYFPAMRPRLAVTPEARRALLRSVNPRVPLPYTPLKLAVPGLTGLAFATLPRWARRMYGLPGTPVTDAAATASLRALRKAGARLPQRLQQLLVPGTLVTHAHARLAAPARPPGAARRARPARAAVRVTARAGRPRPPAGARSTTR